MSDNDFDDLRAALEKEIINPPEYFPSSRYESVDKAFDIYKREFNKLKIYAAFDRTLREIELLPGLDI